MNAVCRICWRHFEVTETDNEEELRAEAVGAHLKLMNSEQNRNPGMAVGPMERFRAVSHAPDFIYGEQARKLRVKRDPGPSLFGEEA